MTAWGQTIVQLPHWMQISSFQTGIFSAMLRRSYLVVPVGKVPSSGIWLTLSWSPRLAMISPRTSLTNLGASAGTGLRMWILLVTALGYLTSTTEVRATSIAAMFLATTSAPLRE